MFDNIAAAQSIAHQYAAIGEKVPDELQAALDKLSALPTAEAPALPVWSELAPEDIPAEAARYFAEVAAVEVMGTDSGQMLRKSLAAHVLQVARQVQPKVHEKVKARFEKMASDYVKAVEKLPTPLTAETILDAGPDALAAFATAKDLGTKMTALARFIGLAEGETAYKTVLRVSRPSSLAEARAIAEAAREVDRYVHPIDPILYTAAAAGVPLELHTPSEQDTLARDLVQAAAADRGPRPRDRFTRGAVVVTDI